MAVPAFHGSIGFNAHHSPMGAFFSFTCGHVGTRGGMAVQSGRPGEQNVFVGIKDGGRFEPAVVRCLPFYEGADKDQPEGASGANFLVEQAVDRHGPEMRAYRLTEIHRHYGWASDRWITPDFEFTIYTPFGEIPEPTSARPAAMREALLPAVTAEIYVDNSAGRKTKTVFFALGFSATGVKIIDVGLPQGRVGFSLRDEMGVAGELVELSEDGRRHGSDETGAQPFVFMRGNLCEGLFDPNVHLLGACPGVGVEVPAGKTFIMRLAMGTYLPHVVTTRLEGRYLYTRYFASLTDVLNEALGFARSIKADCQTCDEKLHESGLNQDQQFLLAHATRSYYGSTQLLDVGGQPYWIVNEGEYCMLNTLDLSVDHVFWELRHNPWVVRNLLDNFVRYYSYHDQVKDPKTGELRPGGISFCHDQGAHNQFSPFGRSGYEMPNLAGCFSYMTAEQLCNWSLIAASYFERTGDTDWVRRNESTLRGCLSSMINRGGNRGFTSSDSAQCGEGSEITTYDSLDHSLAQTRNNVYMAVKCWATYVGLAMLLGEIDPEGDGAKAWQHAALSAKEIAGELRSGMLPAVFEPGNPGHASRILPAVEGVVYPLFWRRTRKDGQVGMEVIAKEFGPLLDALRAHTTALLGDAKCGNHFADGGIKLSSTSNNSWASKIAIFEHVAREVFNLDEFGKERKAKGGADGWEKSDAAHTKWQTEGASAYWACSDQIVSGVAVGSKYYPRIVTTVLWLKGPT